jgi:hypothetical protein
VPDIRAMLWVCSSQGYLGVKVHYMGYIEVKTLVLVQRGYLERKDAWVKFFV